MQMCMPRGLFNDLSSEGRQHYELSYHGNLQKPVEFEIVLTEK